MKDDRTLTFVVPKKTVRAEDFDLTDKLIAYYKRSNNPDEGLKLFPVWKIIGCVAVLFFFTEYFVFKPLPRIDLSEPGREVLRDTADIVAGLGLKSIFFSFFISFAGIFLFMKVLRSYYRLRYNDIEERIKEFELRQLLNAEYEQYYHYALHLEQSAFVSRMNVHRPILKAIENKRDWLNDIPLSLLIDEIAKFYEHYNLKAEVVDRRLSSDYNLVIVDKSERYAIKCLTHSAVIYNEIIENCYTAAAEQGFKRLFLFCDTRKVSTNLPEEFFEKISFIDYAFVLDKCH